MHSPIRRLLNVGLVAGGVLLALSCGRDVTSPDAGRHVARGVSFVTEFPGGPAASLIGELVPFSRVRVVLRNLAGDVVANRLVDFPSAATEVPLSLSVPLASAEPEVMLLTVAYVNAAGDTVFRAGPDSVTLRPSRRGDQPPEPILVEPIYTGPGAEATQVVIAPAADTVVSGDAFTFTATAYNAQFTAVSGAPVGWRSLTPSLATITAIGAGTGVTLAGRGVAKIAAVLANGAADTVALLVLPRAATLELVAGNNQSANAGSALSTPVSVRVRATDGQPMAGVGVTFVPGNSGSVVQATVLTDANGIAATTWTLGAAAGAQSLTASVSGLTGSPITFSATALPVGPVLLHHLPFTSGAVDIVGAAPNALQGAAAVADGVLKLNGGSDALAFSAPLVPTTGSWSLSVFVRSRSPLANAVSFLSQGTAGGPALVVGHDAGGSFRYLDASVTALSFPAPDSLFKHLVIVADSAANTTTVYGNGVPMITGLPFVSVPTGGNPLRLGQGLTGGATAFAGDLDDLRIYRGVISAATVATLWTTGPVAVPGNRIAITSQPSSIASGGTLPSVCVEVQDLVGRRRETYAGTLTIAMGNNPAGATLGGSTSAAALAGEACFDDLTVTGSGVGLTLSVTGPDAIPAASAAFDLSAGAAVRLNGTVFTPSTVAGVPFAPPQVVTAFDGASNVATDFTGDVTVSIASGPGGGALVGTTTVAAVAGVATFANLTMNLPGTYVLEYTAPGLDPFTTSAITVSAPAATQLVFAQQPVGGSVNAALAPPVVVEARTAGNALATGFNGPVTIALAANPGSATLGGTLTVNAANGVATFANLSLNQAANGYTLAATASGLTAATSAPFNIVLAGVTNSWINASGGAWSVGSNWSQGRAPIATDTVAIDLAGTYTVTLDQNYTGALVLLGGASGTQTLQATSRTLSTSLGLRIAPNGVYRQQGGSVGGTGQVRVRGRFETVTAATVAAALFVDTVGTLRVEGSALGGGTTLTASGGLLNNGLIALEALNAAYTVTLAVTTGPLVNAASGTIRALPGAGGVRVLNAELDDSGTLDIQQAMRISRTDAQHNLRRRIALTAASLEIVQSGALGTVTLYDTVSIGAGRTMTISGGSADLSEAAVVGAGVLQLQGVTLTASAATLDAAVSASTTTLLTPLTVPAGDTLRLQTANLSGAALTVNGTLQVLSGGSSVSGPFAVPAGGVVEVRPSALGGSTTFTVANGFTNEGSIVLTALNAAYNATFAVTNGTLVNAPTGTIRTLVGVGGARVLAAQLDNRGTLDLRQDLQLSGASRQHVNQGTIALDSADLNVVMSGTTPSFTNLGSITIGPGRALLASGGLLDLDQGTLTGPNGILSTANVTLAMTPTSVRTVHQFGALTTLAAPYTVPAGDSLRIRSGTLAGPGLTVAGRLTISGATTLNVPFAVAAGGHLLLRASAIAGGFTATVPGGFTNAGLVELITADAAYSVVLAVPSGTLTNAATGTIRSSVGANGGRTLRATLDNSGALDLLHPLTIDAASAAHVNRAPVTLASNLTITQSGTSPSFTNQSAITLATGSTLSVTGGALDLSGGTLVGDTATLSTNNVLLTMTPASARTRFNFGTLTTLSAPYTVPAGDSLRIVGGTLGGPGLTVAGRVTTLANSTLSVPVTMEPTGVLEARSTALAGGHTFTVTNGFTNNGSIELVSLNAAYTTTFAVTNGTLVNGASGVIRTIAGQGGARVLAARLENDGTFDLAQDLTINRASAAHINRGSIPLSAADLTVTQTGTTPSFTNLGSITLAAGRSMTVSGGALTLGGGTLVGHDGTLALSNVTLDMTPASMRTRINFGTGTAFAAPYTVPAGDSLRVLGGTVGGPGLTVAGRFVSLGATNIAAPLTTDPAGVIEARSTTIAGGHALTVANGFTNLGTIELLSLNAAYATAFNVTTGTLVNAPSGVIRTVVGDGGPRTLGAQLDNSGTLDLQHPLTLARASAAHVHRSTLNLTAANLTVTQSGTNPSFTNLGSIAMAAGRTLSVTGGALNLSDGTITGAAATLSLQNVVLSMTPASARTRIDFNTGTAFAAPYEVPAGDSLIVVGGTMGGPGLTLRGRMVTLAATTVAAPFAIASTGELIVRSTSFAGGHQTTVSNGFTNAGVIELRAENAAYTTQLAVTAGTLVNAAGGVIRAEAGSGGGSRTLNAQLDNQGTLLVNAPLTINRGSAAHLNSGLVDVSGANLTLTQSGTTPSLTNTGSITLAAGRTLSVTGGALNLGGGTLVGPAATLATNNVTLSMTPASARTRFDFGTTTTLAAAYTVPELDSLRIVGGTLAGPSLTVAGRVVALGSSTLSLPVITETTGILEARSSALEGSITFTVSNGFTNNGLIDLTAVGLYNTTFSVTNGVLVNSGSGTIRSSVGSGGSRFLSASLDNSGALDIAHPLILNRSGATHVNRSAIALPADLTVNMGAGGSFTNLGSIAIGSEQALILAGGSVDLTGGTITGLTGTLQLGNAAATALTMTAPAQARTRLAFGTAGTQLASTLTIPSGDSLVVVGGTLGGTGTLDIDGILSVKGSTTVSAPIDIDSLGTIRLVSNTTAGGVGLTTPTGWTNRGTIDLTHEGAFSWTTTLAVTSGTLVNAPGATIRALAGSGGARTIAAQLQNQGLVDVQTGLTLSRASSVHSNSGTITVAPAGVFTVTQSGTTPSFSNTGIIALGGSGNRMSVGGGQFINTTGSLTGTGALTFTGTTTADLAMPALNVPVNFGTGTTLANALTVPAGDTLSVLGGTIAGPGLAVNGTLVTTGAATISAPLTTGPSSFIDVRSTTLTAPQSFTVNGVLRLTSASAGINPTLTMTGQTLTVAAGGAIQTPFGAGTSRVFNLATLDNSGTFGVSAAVSLGTGVLQQRGVLTVDLLRTLTVGTLNLYAGSTSNVLGTVTATTCSNLGGTIVGSIVGCP